MRFQVLGSIAVLRDAVPVGVGGPQQRRLLGVLLIARNHLVTTERLVEALWPDGDTPDGVPRSVVTYVSRLRAAIGDGFVETHGSSYRLRLDEATFDVADFEALVTEGESSLPDRAVDCYDRALALWGGDAFGEFTGEWWARPESTRLADLRTVAREERAGALIALGHHARAVPDLDGLVLEHPLRERPVSLLMQALAATGRQADALRAFRSFRARLAEETGLEPSAGLVAFEREVAGALQPSGGGVGRPLRGYVIREVIGEGAHGRVYEATQPGTERRVAIKAIRPDLADSAEFIRRFEAEARLVGRLEHPHIVPLYDYWREPGGAYLVFRYMAGGTARDEVISGGPWSLPRVSQLVEEVGAALIVAHAAGVVHHDVKASNVLLDERGSAYLGDFGIAVHDGGPAGDQPGVRDDVCDFGWMLWELLTGAPPTPGLRASAGGRPERGSAPSLVGRTGDVPEGLDAVLARATDPAGGYRSVAEVVLGWRAAVGRPDGVLSPVASDERRVIDSARRLAARHLAEATAAGVNPYLGLRPFDEADAAGFFGRDVVAEELERFVGCHRLVTVVGASGSGKSSVVRAALVPRLRAAGLTVVAMVPGDDPVAALRQALWEVSSRRGRAQDLATVIRHVLAECGPLVVIVDQLEECWTRSADDRREEFLGVVAGVVDDGPDVRVVATIRADVFDRPLQDPRFGPHIGAGAFVLASMSPAQLGDAITLPAARAGVTVDEGVVADLVAEAASQTGSLPLLQFTLAELYDRRVDGRIGADALLAIGGMAGSICRRAEEVYASLDERSRDDTRALFGRLVAPGDGIPDARRRARLAELSDGVRAVVERYVSARLLVSDRDQVTREPTVEVAHEALLTRWPRLAEWIGTDRRWLTQLQHLATSAQTWDVNGRPAADLYRGVRLEAAIEALDEGRPVAEAERQFIEAGRDARDGELRAARRTARRLRRLLAGVGALLVVALVAGGLAFAAQRRAHREEHVAAHQALVSNSMALRGNKRELAALLALEAHRLAPSAATESALFGTFTAVPALERTVRSEVLEGGTEGVGILIDDETMADSEQSGTVHVVDLATGVEQYSLALVDEDDGYAVWLASTPDGRYLATAWRGGSVDGEERGRGVLSVWDLETRRRRFANVDVPFAMGAVAISSDGSLVAIAGGRDGRTLVYDAATGAQRAEVEPIARPDDATLIINTVGLAFAPDGRLIVGSQAGPIRIVDPATGVEVHRIDAPQETSEGVVRVSPDGRSFVTTGVRGAMRYDLQSDEPQWPEPADTDGCGPQLAYAERLGVLLNFCGVVRAWDLDSGATVESPFDQQAGISCALLDTPDGTTVVQISCSSGDYVLWRLGGDGAASRLLPRATGQQVVFDYTADGRTVLAEQEDDQGTNMTQLIDPNTGVAEPLPGIFGPASTDDPSQVVVAFADETAGRFDLESRAPVGPSVAFAFGVWGWEVTADRTLVWGGAGDGDEFRSHLVALDADGRMAFEVEQADAINDAASPDPDHLVTRDCARLCVLQRRDPVSGVAIGEPAGHAEAGYGSVIGHGGVLVAVAEDGQVLVLDPDTLDPVGSPLPGISVFASALSLSDDGRRLLLVGDRSIRLYDVPSRTQLGDAIPIGPEFGGTLRPDGLEAAVGTEHGIAVWDLDPAHWIAAACAIAGRNLTRAEWEQYIGDLASYRATCPQFKTET